MLFLRDSTVVLVVEVLILRDFTAVVQVVVFARVVFKRFDHDC